MRVKVSLLLSLLPSVNRKNVGQISPPLSKIGCKVPLHLLKSAGAYQSTFYCIGLCS